MNAFFAHPPSGHSFTPRAGTHHGDAGQATSQPGLQHPEPPSGNIIWAREYPTTTDIKGRVRRLRKSGLGHNLGS
ncbi:uncharacterized protein NCU03418 [Neurospora crassa OR74A]|uniref:Uncharacterized protein n=1 Tax=Neurospora crassa (strain ATCC 24698 / 74-OR23-1A / CBS 708.71 / DSM 1257 / FGSC 987) TaxID=367110 RepID=V5IMZ8_NEUCR|nr:uncharacterized protein NCU03418 [Neurospora crassa OR74A]ESA43503.1 hypothetical protein, variant [Neurospora crassa OR74A]|eukprot:XP_011393543.1 uncharacterized protein NCU03418 [Neurospora crassa OR74A]